VLRDNRRQEVLMAAFDVFAREGYDQAGMQQIADHAGVAKPTVYKHFTDKDALFRTALSVAADLVHEDNMAAIQQLRDPGDLHETLEHVALKLLRVCADERACALRRLTYAQTGRFPGLLQEIYERTGGQLHETLADRFARLMISGHLRQSAPQVAAEQFLALLTAPMEARSSLGTRKVTAAETRAVAQAAVGTFASAYL
jgi:TetR/AcrR family transcriptional repressor of mexJK operon